MKSSTSFTVFQDQIVYKDQFPNGLATVFNGADVSYHGFQFVPQCNDTIFGGKTKKLPDLAEQCNKPNESYLELVELEQEDYRS